MPWRPAAKAGALILTLMLLAELNQWPTLDAQYQTSLTLPTWRLFEVVSLVVVALLVGLLSWLLVGLVASLYPRVWQVLKGSTRSLWRRDALVCMVLALAARAGLDKLGELFAGHFHAFAPVDTEIVPAMINAFSPGAGYFLRGLGFSIVEACGLGVAIYVICLGWRKRAWWLWVGILVLLAGLGPSDAHSLREYFAGWFAAAVPLAAVAAMAFWFFRDNVLAYLGALFGLQIAPGLLSLLSQQARVYWSSGLLLALTALLVLAWAFLTARESEVRNEP